ncbi:MAG TPA: hypothetical protein VE981_20190 [Planctomycetota bacterium]|nr:hypothetical protein [Planctomycetota bacterium]
MALLCIISCAATGSAPAELAAGPEQPGWPREFTARGSTIVVYEPQLETLRGNRMTSRSAVSITRENDSDPVFGGVWLDMVLNFDTERKTASPEILRVVDLRFPSLGTDEAARLRLDIADEAPRWNLSYSVDALMAELRTVEEQKSRAEGLKADVPRIFVRSGPAVLVTLEDEPAWRKTADGSLDRLENTSAFIVRDAETCILGVSPFWWTSKDPAGPWQPAATVPPSVVELWKNEPKPATDADADPSQRPEVIATTGAAELVWTDGAPQYVPIAGTDLLYVKNTDSDLFLDTREQQTYALFSGRWYRTPQSKDAWGFVASDQLPADFARIPLGSPKGHVLACVAGTAPARNAVLDAGIPQTEAVKTGPAPDLQVNYDGQPQFTPVADTPVRYAVNTPYSIFCVDSRYYWCLDGIWYDSDFAVGPWFVCGLVPRTIYLIPPSCPHYYVTYCRVFSATPSAVYVGYYPGYRGCYVWRGSVVYGTGWHYRPWVGTQCYTRPVTWGVGVHYSPIQSGWSIRVGIGSVSGYRVPRVQAGVGGTWGGRSSGVSAYRKSPSPAPVFDGRRDNLYRRQLERLAPNPARPSSRPPQGGPEFPRRMPPTGRDGSPSTPDRTPSERERREIPKPPPPPRNERTETPEHREAPKPPPPPRREEPREAPRRLPPPPPQDERREIPRTPPPIERQPREIPKRPPPPQEERREAPKPPPPSNRETPPREAPKPPPPPRERREAPRTPPPQKRGESPRNPPPSSDRRR